MKIGSSNEISLRLREERERLGLSLVVMADATKVGRSTLANYEANLTSPTIEYVGRLDDIGVDTFYVLNGIRSAGIFTNEQPDLLWAAVEATLKLAAKHPDLPCSNQALGATVIKLYGLLVRENSTLSQENNFRVASEKTEANH